jgi:hypothetical protein
MYLHLGAAPEQMRVRELSQPAAVAELLRTEDPRLFADAVRAETRPHPGDGIPGATTTAAGAQA